MNLNNNKRDSLKTIATLTLLSTAAPSRWTRPVIDSVVLPAHAQTSFGANCSGVETEPVNEPISITVTDTEILGPIAATRIGNSFAGTVTNDVGQCVDSSNRTEVVEFSGTIDSENNQIDGVFNVTQYCGDALSCEQLATFSATQNTPQAGNDLGEYQGSVIGTLRCCIDFL